MQSPQSPQASIPSTCSHPLGTRHSSLTVHVFHKTSLSSLNTFSSASIAHSTSRCSYSGITLACTTLTFGSLPFSNRRSSLRPSTKSSLPQTQKAKGGTWSSYQACEAASSDAAKSGDELLSRSHSAFLLSLLGFLGLGDSRPLSILSSALTVSLVARMHLCLAKHSRPSHHLIDSALTYTGENWNMRFLNPLSHRVSDQLNRKENTLYPRYPYSRGGRMACIVIMNGMKA